MLSSDKEKIMWETMNYMFAKTREGSASHGPLAIDFFFFTIYLVPEGSGNRNCQNRKPVISSVNQSDSQDSRSSVAQHSSSIPVGV